jgi:thiol-disulfide isomerase/thioredoxin
MRFILGLFIVLAIVSCTTKREVPIRSTRYEAVKALRENNTEWCDHTFAQKPVRLRLPSTVAALPNVPLPELQKGKSVWVNLWATWCQPCLREMPLLLTWQKDLKKDGVDVELLFLSVDDEPRVLENFLAQHKDIPAEKVLRVSSLEQYQTWIETYGSNPAAAIPIHLMAGVDGQVRCLRTGSLREGDYPTVRALYR